MTRKTLSWASAGLALSTLWPAAALAETASWRAERSAAVEAYWSGDYAGAERRLLSALDHATAFGTTDPRLAATLNDLALTYFRLGRYADAPGVSGSRTGMSVRRKFRAEIVNFPYFNDLRIIPRLAFGRL